MCGKTIGCGVSPEGSRYGADQRQIACIVGEHTLLDTTLEWPPLESPHPELGYDPASVGGIIHGPPHQLIQSPYRIPPYDQYLIV